MTTERLPSAPPPARAPRRPISLASIEVIVARAVALFGLLFGAQAIPAVLSQRELVSPLWWWTTVALFYAALLANTFAAAVKTGTRVTNAVVAVTFVAAVAAWVPGVLDTGWPSGDRPWLWFVITVATASAAVAFSVRWATVYLVVVPVVYGILRVSEYGGLAPAGITALDVLYAMLLGGVILVIITMLRSAASVVDTAQATALSKYLDAVGEHAREAERVHVDALVHDNVLSALLAAGRARADDEHERATTLARNAIEYLAHAGAEEPPPAGILVRLVATRIQEEHAVLAKQFEVRCRDLRDQTVPARVAEAVCSAALQAMVNSVQHAGDEFVKRWIEVSSGPDGGVAVEVGDSGVGFVFGDVPAERLGVRVSIIERMEGVGGDARVVSAPGEGTVVRISWHGEEDDR